MRRVAKSAGSVVVLEDEPDSEIVKHTIKALASRYDVMVIAVTDETSDDEVVEKCWRQKPIGLVVDYRLRGRKVSRNRHKTQKRGSNGLDIARRIVSQVPMPVTFLTRYPEDHAPLYEFDPRIAVRQFTKPGHGRNARAEAEAIANDLASSMSQQIKEQRTAVERVRVPELALSIKQFDALELEEQISTLAEMREAVGSACDDCFDDPDVSYVVVVGPDVLITQVGRAGSGIGPGGFAKPPTEAALRLIAMRYGYVPLVIMRTGELRLIDCERQSRPSGWFPTMRVESNGSGFELPVDSGSTYSIMCDIYASERKLVPIASSSFAFIPYELRTARGERFVLMARSHELNALLPASGGGQVNAVWPLLTATNYVDRGLARDCHVGVICGLGSSRGGQTICSTWLGVLGRDIFANNGLRAVMDFPQRRVWVE